MRRPTPAGGCASTWARRWPGCIVIPALPDFYDALPRHPARPGRERPAGGPDQRQRGLRDPRRRAASTSRWWRGASATCHLVTVASPGYLKRHGVPAHPSDLEDGHMTVDFFSARTGACLSARLREGRRDHRTGRAATRCRSTTATPTWRRCWPAWASRRLRISRPRPTWPAANWCRCWPTGAPEPCPMHVVYPPNRHLSAKVRAFVDWAAELFAKHPHL